MKWMAGFSKSYLACMLALVASPAISRAAANPTFGGWASGPATGQTITAQIIPADADLGAQGRYYLGAVVDGRFFFSNGSTWLPYTSGTIPSYAQGPLASQSIPVVQGLNVTPLSGVAIFAGYGLSQADLLNGQKYAEVYRIPVSTAPQLFVSPAAASIAVGSPTPLQLHVTSTDGSGNATALTMSATTLQWQSSNPQVATVDANGIVTPVAAGTATITATSGASATPGAMQLTVVPPATSRYANQTCASAWGASTAHSAWVYPNAQGLLAYQPLDANGNRIMDFSSAGYMGGGVAIPTPAQTVLVTPLGQGQDDTSNIQTAINTVSNLPMGSDGFRGVVMLGAGNFSVSGTLQINASGVVLRGSGSGTTGTVITDTSPLQNSTTAAIASPGTGAGQTVLTVAGTGSYVANASTTVDVIDTFVPAGATTLTLSKTSGLAVGSTVVIARPVTAAWVSFMGMANIGPGESWMLPGEKTQWVRSVVAINGNQIVLDAPLSDSIDSTYVSPPGATVSLQSVQGEIEQVGVEHIRFVGVPRTANTSNNMLEMNNLVDAWVDDVVGDNFTSGLTVGGGAARVTARSVVLTHEHNGADVPCTGAKFAEFSIGGAQILLDRSSSTGAAASFYYVTETRAPGPNVVLNFQGTPDAVCSIGSIQPHQRWATGLLIDGATLAPNLGRNSSVAASVDFWNRGSAGSGQGWAAGWGVVWNTTGSFAMQAPPGSMNWTIGSTGTVVPQSSEPAGLVDSPNVPVAPQSLYLAQLCERLGPQALRNLGY